MLAPEEAEAFIPDLPDNAAAGLLLASFALTGGDRSAAAEILTGLEPGTLRERIEWELPAALAAPAHDLDQAHVHLSKALTMAKPHRYVTTVVQSGAGIADLLRSMPTASGLEG